MSELNTQTDTQPTEPIKQKSKMSMLVLLAWVFSIIFLLAGLGNLSDKPLAGLLEILTGLSLLPLFWTVLKNIWGVELKRRYKIAIFIVLFILSGSVYGQSATPPNSLNSTAGLQDKKIKVQLTQSESQITSVQKQTPLPTKIPTPTIQYLAPTSTPTPIVQQPTSTSSNSDQGNSPASSSNGSVPAGATALCNDGTYSYAAHHQGACSHHGGVNTFYN